MTMRAARVPSAGTIPGLQAALDAKADKSDTPSVVANQALSAQVADANVPAFYAVPVSGMYRVSAYVVLTQAATTSSVMPGCSVSYTEQITSQAVQDIITLSANTNLVGLHTGGSVIIQASQGTNIGYVTSGYASVGATPMQYAIRVKIEFLD